MNKEKVSNEVIFVQLIGKRIPVFSLEMNVAFSNPEWRVLNDQVYSKAKILDEAGIKFAVHSEPEKSNKKLTILVGENDAEKAKKLLKEETETTKS
ncbi:hypothetical protein HXX01_00685 [Candidatus Nomurabacteria bacterium]|nr:hypothetical protein [Candidatus Nomurabacteria bacterium]